MVWVHKVLQGREDVTGKVIDMLCDGKALSMNNIKELPWPAEFLRALKAIPCPYHRYFWLTPAMLAEEIAAAKTKGTRAEQVMKVEQELFALYADPQLEEKPEQLSFRGGAYYSEVAVELINAIYNNHGRGDGGEYPQQRRDSWHRMMMRWWKPTALLMRKGRGRWRSARCRRR